MVLYVQSMYISLKVKTLKGSSLKGEVKKDN